MAEPSEKSPAMAKFLEDMAGRTSAIRADKCVRPPFGCGGPAMLDMATDLEKKEYSISGLCVICQRKFFG